MFRLSTIGNLAADPVAGRMPSNDEVSNFVVIHNHNWKDINGNAHSRKTTVRCSVIGKQAKVANQYLWKGRQVYLEGYLDANEYGYPKQWTGNDGVVRTAYNLIVTSFTLLGSSKDRPVPANTSDQALEEMFVSGEAASAPAQAPTQQPVATVTPVAETVPEFPF